MRISRREFVVASGAVLASAAAPVAARDLARPGGTVLPGDLVEQAAVDTPGDVVKALVAETTIEPAPADGPT